MKDQLKTSNRATLKDILNATSSLASESGLTLSDEQGGLTTEPSGPVAVPANLSPRQAKERGLLTSDTSGRLSSISSESAVLGQCLANRLQAKTALVGSTLFKLIWKQRSTPAGRSICALRASALRTSGKDSTGWPTTRQSDGEKNVRSLEGSLREIERKGGPQDLCQASQLTGWATTTTTRDWKDTGDLSKSMVRKDGKLRNDTIPRQASLASWPTPMAGTKATETYNEAGNTDSSRKTVALVAPWSTPRANKWGFPDAHGSHEGPLVSGKTAIGSPASTAKPGQLNPAHSRWLMGLPTAWDSCGGMVIRLSRRKRKLLLKPT